MFWIFKKKTIETKEKHICAFISYSAIDKLIGAEVKSKLENFGISSFLAHDDINISEVWERRIINELNKADIFVALLSQNFKESEWAPQELGIASNRGILIIPFSLDGTVPFGFIDHLQAKPGGPLSVPTEYLAKPILDKYPEHMIGAISVELGKAFGWRYCESLMELLKPYFGRMSQRDIDRLVDSAIRNDQVWDAHLCKTEYLPLFVRINKNKIAVDKLKLIDGLIVQKE